MTVKTHPAQSPCASWARVLFRILCALAILSLVAIRLAGYQPLTTGGGPTGPVEGLILVGHAGVGLPGAAYSNAREALDAAATRGFPMVEVDLLPTSDGVLVASHDWGQVYRELHWSPAAVVAASLVDGILPAAAPHSSDFLTTPMRGGLTPQSGADIAVWLAAHPSIRLVTDTKADNISVLTRFAALPGLPKSQVVAQIYHREELAPVRALGFGGIIFTLYRESIDDIDGLIAFAGDNDLIVTIAAERLTPPLLRRFEAAGLPVYVHTVNSPEEAQRLREAGVDGLYTDFLLPASR